jgi:RNA polymerase sigma-70 factor, ECF subfamily
MATSGEQAGTAVWPGLAGLAPRPVRRARSAVGMSAPVQPVSVLAPGVASNDASAATPVASTAATTNLANSAASDMPEPTATSAATPASPSMPNPDADQALVALAQSGNHRAYEMLVVKYQRRIERLIGRMVRDVDVVQDIAQETFIRAWRALGNFRGEAQFYTWLYRIAVNSAKKHLMDVKRDPVITEAALRGAQTEDEDGAAEWSLLNGRGSDADNPEAAYAAKEIAQAVNEAMDALPEELRQAITLRELEGLSYEEISEMMNCPIGTVRSRIFRAREAISTRIKPMLAKQTGKRW